MVTVVMIHAFDPKVKAFREKRIFGCNTFSSTYYDDIVLHPAWILADLAAVFHPDLMKDYRKRYFQPLIDKQQ